MVRKYEACFLLRADLPEEAFEKEIVSIEESILKNGGAIVKKELWGRKNLSYPIKKRTEAVYYLFYFEASPDSLGKIEDNLRNKESILRYLVLQRKTLLREETVNVQSQSE